MASWWIGGGLLALYFSSAGPCYYGLIGLPTILSPSRWPISTASTTRLPIWALDTQQLLWDGYTGKLPRALGISAFPSMHNAMAMIFVLVGFSFIAGSAFSSRSTSRSSCSARCISAGIMRSTPMPASLIALLAWWADGPGRYLVSPARLEPRLGTKARATSLTQNGLCLFPATERRHIAGQGIASGD